MDDDGDTGPLTNEVALGSAKMETDGTIIVDYRIRLPNGIRGLSRKTFKPGDPAYERIIRRAGGLEPGEDKLIYPLPDD
jgi:hypothetical protein